MPPKKARSKGQRGQKSQRVCLHPLVSTISPIGHSNASLQGRKKGKKATNTRPKKPTIVPLHNGITFFDLPLDIRMHIYKYAGLWRPCVAQVDDGQSPRYFGYDTPCTLEGNFQPGLQSLLSASRPCRHPPFPMALLGISRAVREEVALLFASRNKFGTILAYKSDLDFFQGSIGWGMGYLKALHIELRPSDQRYLKLTGGAHNTMWKIWTAFCKLVREKMPQLRAFSLRCKIKLPEVADKLFAEMHGFPLLTHCAFHLHTAPNDKILSRTKRASWALTGNLDRPPFPFLHLPKEVQLLVLEFLLTGHSDPYVGGENNMIRDFPWTIMDLQSRRPQQTVCCGNCSPTRAMCFCASRQCSFSTSCFCFTSPVPYFLVSHEFYKMAHHIFYSRNSFAFVGEDPEPMMRKTNNIPTSTFRQIRNLAFMFPAIYRFPVRSAYKAEEAALMSWSVWRRFIREHFDLERLTVCFVDFGTKNNPAPGTSNRTKYLRKLVSAFADLRGLRNFRVFLVDDPGFGSEARRIVLGDRAADIEPYVPEQT